ncbi:response regulator [Paenibacillus tianjinensis]|uniref:Response regulator n=1 Tax=Paenibacillus tianjinensis TaxID=2810347 RepID=A0ABX7LAZ3_9BACL|nr:response regulator [Paenibacillus tianjinensis]QSF44516.1 response regulator [Paenibacillus tianjinensis]
MEEYKRTVLYVEDNELNMALMHHIFKKNLPSLLLLKAETAEIGLDIAVRQLPDLIILDIGLPGLNGYEALEWLKAREDTRHIPVVAISAFALRTDIERARETGFAAYITKPFQVSVFTDTVKTLLAWKP